MDWGQIGLTLGVSTLFLIAIGVFFGKQIWPFITKRIEAADARAVVQNDALIKAMMDNALINQKTATILEDMSRNIAKNTEAIQRRSPPK